MPPAIFRIDPENPGDALRQLRSLFQADPLEARKLIGDHLTPSIEDILRRNDPKLMELLGRAGPTRGQGPLINVSKGRLSGRNFGSFGNILVTATTVSNLSFQTLAELKDCRLFFSDPNGILLSMSALKVGSQTVDMQLAQALTVASGATTGSAGADMAAYRSQVLDFDPFTDGFPLGDLPTAISIQLSLITSWTAGTPYIGLGFNTSSPIASAKLYNSCGNC